MPMAERDAAAEVTRMSSVTAASTLLLARTIEDEGRTRDRGRVGTCSWACWQERSVRGLDLARKVQVTFRQALASKLRSVQCFDNGEGSIWRALNCIEKSSYLLSCTLRGSG